MKTGFSLVELAIVLVILGLLVGGILSGQSLIRAAELRSVTTDFNRYITATNTFRDQYGALPGDMPNATAYWGSAGGNGGNSACQNAAHTGTLTCNGDGDGIVSLFSPYGIAETGHYWQQLAIAGLIEGTYNPVTSGSIPGVNTPKSRLGANYFYLYPGGGVKTGNASSYGGDMGKNMYAFWNSSMDNVAPNLAPFKPEEAWNLDTKMDDGLPGTGAIIATKNTGGVALCSSGDDVAPPGDANATYTLNNSAKDCALIFKNIF